MKKKKRGHWINDQRCDGFGWYLKYTPRQCIVEVKKCAVRCEWASTNMSGHSNRLLTVTWCVIVLNTRCWFVSCFWHYCSFFYSALMCNAMQHSILFFFYHENNFEDFNCISYGSCLSLFVFDARQNNEKKKQQQQHIV